jgi:hypothetical protein
MRWFLIFRRVDLGLLRVEVFDSAAKLDRRTDALERRKRQPQNESYTLVVASNLAEAVLANPLLFDAAQTVAATPEGTDDA